MNPITQLCLEKEGEGLALDYTPASQKQNHFLWPSAQATSQKPSWGLQEGETGVTQRVESVGSCGFRDVHYGLYTARANAIIYLNIANYNNLSFAFSGYHFNSHHFLWMKQQSFLH